MYDYDTCSESDFIKCLQKEIENEETGEKHLKKLKGN